MFIIFFGLALANKTSVAQFFGLSENIGSFFK
jgi:hypothetical protein